MKYYRDQDYFLFFEDFPRMGIPGVIVSNGDGTVSIYINTLYSEDRQHRTLKHELRHMAKNHLFCDNIPLSEKELDADDLNNPDCEFAEDFFWVEYIGEEQHAAVLAASQSPPRLPDVFFEAPPGKIPLFESLGIFGNYLRAMCDQRRQDQNAS